VAYSRHMQTLARPGPSWKPFWLRPRSDRALR